MAENLKEPASFCLRPDGNKKSRPTSTAGPDWTPTFGSMGLKPTLALRFPKSQTHQPQDARAQEQQGPRQGHRVAVVDVVNGDLPALGGKGHLVLIIPAFQGQIRLRIPGRPQEEAADRKVKAAEGNGQLITGIGADFSQGVVLIAAVGIIILGDSSKGIAPTKPHPTAWRMSMRIVKMGVTVENDC